MVASELSETTTQIDQRLIALDKRVRSLYRKCSAKRSTIHQTVAPAIGDTPSSQFDVDKLYKYLDDIRQVLLELPRRIKKSYCDGRMCDIEIARFTQYADPRLPKEDNIWASHVDNYRHLMQLGYSVGLASYSASTWSSHSVADAIVMDSDQDYAKVIAFYNSHSHTFPKAQNVLEGYYR